MRGLEEEAAQNPGQAAAQEEGHRAEYRTVTWQGLHTKLSYSAARSAPRSSCPAVLGVAGVLKEAGLGTHGSLFHLL